MSVGEERVVRTGRDTSRQLAPSDDWDPLALPDRWEGGARGSVRVEEYARLREECPVAHSSAYGGYWTLTKFRDVAEAARDHKHFRSGRPFVEMPDFRQSIPIGLNPPEHATFRRMLNKYFAPERMSELEPTIRGYVDALLDPMLLRGQGDLAQEFAMVLPAQALSAFLHMPDGAWRDLVAHIERLDEIRDDPSKLNQVVVGLFDEQVHRLVEVRRRQPHDPERDLMSGVLAMEIDGRPLPEETVVAIGTQIIAAGHGTTTDALTGVFYRLATNPDIQARLRRDPSLIPDAVEEFLRLEVSLHQLGRQTAEDVEVRGCVIPAGSFVALNFASANRDGEEFEHPDACIIDREPNRHLTFGHGVHKCVGAPLARLELRLAVERILARTRAFEVAGTTRARPAMWAGGFSRLPMRFLAAVNDANCSVNRREDRDANA
jgi:cytochrome P450